MDDLGELTWFQEGNQGVGRHPAVAEYLAFSHPRIAGLPVL